MTIEKLIAIIADVTGEDESSIKAETTFKELELDSLSIQEILMDIEDEFGVSIEPAQVGETVASLAEAIEANK